MHLILLSGGSGKRLWPLSNDARSKQFLKVLSDEDGNPESMVQRVWRQLHTAGLAGSAVISTGKAQVDIIQNQLGDVPLVVEPERRDTFPAIALAAAYLQSEKGVGPEEVVCVFPVDPFVEVDFFKRIKDLAAVLEASEADLALMGVKPTYPAEKYGYIVPKKTQNSAFIRVDYFVEKPSERMARELIGENALWNCGIFAFKLGYVTSLVAKKNLPSGYPELLQRFKELPKISFDYEVVEKAENVAACTYDGVWKDLGTWNTLTEEMASPVMGRGIISTECVNTHLLNELEIPVTVLGLSNTVVAASPDGILVTDKSASPKVKEIIAKIEQRPMYEERRWGWYKVLDYQRVAAGDEVLTKKICIKAGKNLSYQTHQKRREIWTIVNGSGVFVLEDKVFEVGPGKVLEIPVSAKHAIKADTDLELIEVQIGSELVEEDIERLCMTWDEVCKRCGTTSTLDIGEDI